MSSIPAPILGDNAEEAMLPRAFRVIGRRLDTPDTATLELESENDEALRFDPGQFNMIYVFGIGEVPISISGDPIHTDTLVHTVRSVGAVSAALVALDVGDRVGIRGPFGRGWPMHDAADGDLVIVAGGIGLAPLRPVVYEVLARRHYFHSVSLVYGARSPADLLFVDELHAWRRGHDVDVEVTVDRSDEGWRGDVGVVTSLLHRIDFDPTSTVALVCGPEIMMKVVANELVARGVQSGQVHVSLERNMKCAIGFCGHCQFGPDFLCRDGPVLPYQRVKDRMRVPEL